MLRSQAPSPIRPFRSLRMRHPMEASSDTAGMDPPTASPSTIGAPVGAMAFCGSGSGKTKPVMARSAMTAAARR
jgi:hypothetical protein